MTADDVRKKYLDFFKTRGHEIIPSAPLVPENDPTTLFTGSGMQPLLPYLLGQRHPKGTRLVDSQKCFRAEDIEEVGDNRHTTFFEMLGNWSLGDYFKDEQLEWFFTFLTDSEKGVGIPKEKLWVTCFAGDDELGIPKDTESAGIWKRLGIPEDRILFYDAKKNWWSRSGTPKNMPAGEPGGPDSETFFDFGEQHGFHENSEWKNEECHPNCDCGRFMEIGNSVFMEYIKQEDGSFAQLPQKNVDFGGGLERIVAAANDDPDVFRVDVFRNAIKKLEDISSKRYGDEAYTKSFRIIADHLRAAIFLINDGMLPGKTDREYFVRRLIRRAVRHADILGLQKGDISDVVFAITDVYLNVYVTKPDQAEYPYQIILREEEKFRLTLEKGMKQFEKASTHMTFTTKITKPKVKTPMTHVGTERIVDAETAFELFTTYGFPIELTQEIASDRGLSVDIEGFNKLMEEHREKSRAGAEQKFKGGLADAGDQTVKLHTATHLMLAGLRKYLGDHVHQAGSNITEKRTRFDFTHPEKVDRETLDKVEAYVNEAIRAGSMVEIEQMEKDKAKERGVEGSFWEKYPDTVNVYKVVAPDGTTYSQELCGGPHVETTEGMGTFRIVKEEASSAGVRRIKAVLE